MRVWLVLRVGTAPSTAKGGRGGGVKAVKAVGGTVSKRRGKKKKKGGEIKEMHMAAGWSDKGAGTEDKQMRPRRAGGGRRGGGAVIE